MLRIEAAHTYYGDSHILRGVDAVHPTATSLGLLGRNGMGKTTLIRTLMGYVRPASGRVLLLDEPLAGMGAEETERMLSLLANLKATHAILLVEHDMDAVFRIADRITVMVNGTVIATGDPASIRVNPEVRTAYLGEDH